MNRTPLEIERWNFLRFAQNLCRNEMKMRGGHLHIWNTTHVRPNPSYVFLYEWNTVQDRKMKLFVLCSEFRCEWNEVEKGGHLHIWNAMHVRLKKGGTHENQVAKVVLHSDQWDQCLSQHLNKRMKNLHILPSKVYHIFSQRHKCHSKRYPNVYGHTTLKTPVLVWSPKLSNVGPG